MCGKRGYGQMLELLALCWGELQVVSLVLQVVFVCAVSKKVERFEVLSIGAGLKLKIQLKINRISISFIHS